MMKEFGRLFLGILIAFSCKRLMQHIDLLMIAPFGDLYVAAYSVPMNFNLLDFAIFVSIAPIISIRLSKGLRNNLFNEELLNFRNLFVILGIIVSFASYFIYQLFIYLQVKNPEIAAITSKIVPWCALGIYPESISCCLSMVAFVLGKEKPLLVISIATLLLDACLNYIFGYALGAGFTGIYIATFCSSCFNSLATVYLLRKQLQGLPTKLPEFTWLRTVGRQVFPEFWRIILERGALFAAFSILHANAMNVASLSAFTVAINIRILFGITTIAFYRSIAIILSKKFGTLNDAAIRMVVTITKFALYLAAIILVGFLYAGNYLATNLYGLDSGTSMYWWHTFSIFFIVIFLSDLLVGVYKGLMNFTEQYGKLAKIDILAQWLLFLPIFYYGIYADKIYVVWSSFILTNSMIIFACHQSLLQVRTYETSSS